MSDTTSTSTSTDEGTGAPAGTVQETTQQSADTQTVDSLPEWAREKLTKANNEAAKYRTEKNDAVNAAKAAVTQEFETKLAEAQAKHDELTGKLSARELELIKLRTALDLDIPSKAADKFASLLQGTNEDEIKSAAQDAKALFGSLVSNDRPTDPTQGSGNHMPLNGDPILNAIKRAVRV
ncbi:hypothetical protein N806_31220 [Rhodococcus sp. P27]|nr:hypothetical protein N806_31220 [Rhodococcus sp. P27]